MSANYASGTMGYDLTFELNEFGNPRIRSEIETVKDVLLTVLFTRKGEIPSLPTVGIGLEDFLYEAFDEIDEDALKQDIVEQCEMMQMYFSRSAIQIKKLTYKDKPLLMIQINGTETYPSSYLHDNIGVSDQYNIGISFDETNNLVYAIS